jgi:hypothetical protein
MEIFCNYNDKTGRFVKSSSYTSACEVRLVLPCLAQHALNIAICTTTAISTYNSDDGDVRGWNELVQTSRSRSTYNAREGPKRTSALHSRQSLLPTKQNFSFSFSAGIPRSPRQCLHASLPLSDQEDVPAQPVSRILLSLRLPTSAKAFSTACSGIIYQSSGSSSPSTCTEAVARFSDSGADGGIVLCRCWPECLQAIVQEVKLKSRIGSVCLSKLPASTCPTVRATVSPIYPKPSLLQPCHR